LKELLVGKELVNIEVNYSRIQSQAANILQAIKRMQNGKEIAEAF
jgi:hypothetical protein